MNHSKDTGQAAAPRTCPFGQEAFFDSDNTTVRWLGSAGLFLNSHGTCMMLDPVLTDFSLPLLVDVPVYPNNVPFLDGILITHSDEDHFSVPTCQALRSVCKSYHTTRYVSELMAKNGIIGTGHDIGEPFVLGSIKITLTPADHSWQNDVPSARCFRTFLPEDCCGFWLETPDGTIWAPGDSRLLSSHLQMPKPNLILFDFSDDSWHFGLENAIKLANAYPDARLLLSHWGTYDAPDRTPFNANPKDLEGKIINPDRILLLAPGEAHSLSSRKAFR